MSDRYPPLERQPAFMGSRKPTRKRWRPTERELKPALASRAAGPETHLVRTARDPRRPRALILIAAAASAAGGGASSATGVSQVGDEYLNQKVQDAQGRTFSADSAAGIYLKDNQVLLETINPANSARGVRAFDMPVGATPVSITLKDLSLFSGGTTVTLKQPNPLAPVLISHIVTSRDYPARARRCIVWQVRECSSVVEHQLPKLNMRVRFSSLALRSKNAPPDEPVGRGVSVGRSGLVGAHQHGPAEALENQVERDNCR